MRISDWSSDVCSSDLLGRQCPRVHAPHAATEADERTDVRLECSNGEVSEAGRPKPATTGVEWPPDATEAVNRFSSRFDAPNNYSTSGKRRCTEYAIPAPRPPPRISPAYQWIGQTGRRSVPLCHRVILHFRRCIRYARAQRGVTDTA